MKGLDGRQTTDISAPVDMTKSRDELETRAEGLVKMDVEIRDERFRQVVDVDGQLERVATGFMFTEGATWDAKKRELIFSDMPGNIMRKWSADNGVEAFRQPSNMANGNFWDREGRLITCEHATSRLVRQEHDGSMTTLASHYDEKEVNSPNDVVVRSDGTILSSATRQTYSSTSSKARARLLRSWRA